jgi:hypothetical protein
MRTTVDIPDPIYRKLKATAALKGCTVRDMLLEMVEKELGETAGARHRTRLPLVKSESPGSLHLTNDRVNEILSS